MPTRKRAEDELPVFHSRYPGERLHALAHDPIAFLRRLAREHGDAVRFRLGTHKVVLLSHPDMVPEILVDARENFIKDSRVRHSEYLIGDGLINSEGAFHLKQRRLIQPAFHRRRLAIYSAIMVRHAARMAEMWRTNRDTPVDIGAEMMRLTLEIVGETLFGKDVTAEAGAVSRALNIVLERFGMALMPFTGFLIRLPLPGASEMREAQATLDEIIYAMIAQRRREPPEILEARDDLLSLLLSARDEEDGTAMSDRQIHDEAMTLFLAGQETTANALTWTFYLLARHPAVCEALYRELRAVLGSDPRLPTEENLLSLVYTRQVLAEAIRLYPPIWIIARGAINEYRLKTSGKRIPAGALVLFSQCVLHTDTRWWGGNPGAFDPERFTLENSVNRQRHAYLPFGAGPHTCIGEQFAWREGILLLATLLRYCPRLLPVSPEPVEAAPLLTLRPKSPILLRVEGA